MNPANSGHTRVRATVFVALAASACEANPLDLGLTDGGALDGDGAVAVLATAGQLPSSCNQPAGSNIPFASADDLASLLAGVWLFCSGPQDFLAPNQVGVEWVNGQSGLVTRFHLLYVDGADRLIRGSSAGDSGTVTFHDDGASDAGGRLLYLELTGTTGSLAAAISLTREPLGVGLWLSPNDHSYYLAPVGDAAIGATGFETADSGD